MLLILYFGVNTIANPKSLEWRDYPLGALAQFAISAALWILRAYIVRHALKEVKPDVERFDLEWERLRSKASTRIDLQALADRLYILEEERSEQDTSDARSDVKATHRADPKTLDTGPLEDHIVQAAGSMRVSNLMKIVLNHGSSSLEDFMRPFPRRVESLDQLYTISSLILPIWRHKVANWALQSLGSLRIRSEAWCPPYSPSSQTEQRTDRRRESQGILESSELSLGSYSHSHSQSASNTWSTSFSDLATLLSKRKGSKSEEPSGVGVPGEAEDGALQEAEDAFQFLPYHLIRDEVAAENRVAWTAQKSSSRAMDKLVRSYGNEVFRLLDITREMIIFDTIPDLIKCIEAIYQDPECQVLGVLNRLSVHYDSRTTAGWRDVTICLRITSPEAREWGLDGHCCELRLALRSFLKHKKRDQHLRYLEFSRVHCYRYLHVLAKLRLRGADAYMQLCKALRTWKPADARRQPDASIRKSRSYNIDSLAGMKQWFGLQKSEDDQQLATQSLAITAENVGHSTRQMFEDSFDLKKLTMMQRCMLPGGTLGSILYQNRNAYMNFTSGTVTQTATPVTTFLSNRWASSGVGAAFLLALLVLQVGPYAALVMRNFRVEASHFRMEVLSERGGQPPSLFGNITVSDFGVLQDGCTIPGMILNLTFSPNSCHFSTSSPVSINQWYFKTWSGPVDRDPVEFRFETSTDGHTWKLRSLGSCSGFSKLSFFDPTDCYYGHSSFNTTTVRQAKQVFDLRVPLHTQVIQHGIQVVLAVAISISIGFVVMQQPVIAKFCVARGGQLGGLLVLGASYWGLAAGDLDNVVFPVLLSFETLLVFGLIAFEKWMPFFLVVHVAILAVLPACHTALVTKTFSLGGPPFEALYIGVLVALYGVFRLNSRQRVRRRIFQIKEGFDSIWNELRQSQPLKLRQLQIVIAGVPTRTELPRQRATQHGVNRVSALFLKHQRDPKVLDQNFTTTGEAPLVKSLDLLYSHAAGTIYEFRRKVRLWALASDGCFPLRQEGGEQCDRTYMRFEFSDQMNSKMEFSGLKSVDRSVEKLQTCLGKDVSRLLDVCRERIVFETIDDLTRCVEVITKDLEVEILQIKHRLSEAYDGWKTAGFRSVTINIRVVTAETLRLGVDGHVSEIQLVLGSFWKLLDKTEHADYISWRNVRSC